MHEFRYIDGGATLALDPDKCTGCGACLDVCPHAVLEKGCCSKVRIARREACMECGACALNCAFGALTVTAGVGCAAAVINGALGRQSACCCTTTPRPDSEEPGAASGGCCC